MPDALTPVTVQSISGREATFSLRNTCAVRELKGKLSDAWHIPPYCQQLLLGCDIILEDDEPLADVLVLADGLRQSLCASGDAATTEALQLTMAVSDVDALRRLAHGRAVAVEVLCHVAERGDMHVLQCLVQRLSEDTWRDDWFTRRAAVMTLCTLAEEGDVEHWNLLQRLMKLDPDWRVRLAALEAQEAHVSPQTAEVIATMLQDEQWRVRRAALTILARVAKRGDEHIVGEICRILEVSD